jgi:hypothetical protein
VLQGPLFAPLGFPERSSQLLRRWPALPIGGPPCNAFRDVPRGADEPSDHGPNIRGAHNDTGSPM